MLISFGETRGMLDSIYNLYNFLGAGEPDFRPWLSGFAVFVFFSALVVLPVSSFLIKSITLNGIKQLAVMQASKDGTIFIHQEWPEKMDQEIFAAAYPATIPIIVMGFLVTMSPEDMHWHLTSGFTLFPSGEYVLLAANVSIALFVLIFFGGLMRLLYLNRSVFPVSATFMIYYVGLFGLFSYFCGLIAIYLMIKRGDMPDMLADLMDFFGRLIRDPSILFRNNRILTVKWTEKEVNYPALKDGACR
jgi:hypothetical protein